MAQTSRMRVRMAENFAQMYANGVDRRTLRIVTNGLSRYIFASEDENPRFDRMRFLSTIWAYMTDERHFVPSEYERGIICEQWSEFFHIACHASDGPTVQLFPVPASV